MQTPHRIRVFTAHIDPNVPTSHEQPISLAFPPFSSGQWSISYVPAQPKNKLYQPSAVKLRWNNCNDTTTPSVRLAVEADGAVHTLVEQLSRSYGCRGEWILLVGRPSKPFKVVLEVEKPKEPVSATERCMTMIDAPQAIDVCLTFPGDSRTLFASSAMLAAVSPWWSAYLSTTGFYEDTISVSHTPAEPAWPDSDCSDDDDDDDDEETRLGVKASVAPDSPPPSPPLRTRPLIPRNMRVVPISGTSYRTFRAFLAWTYAGTVHFAPLTSSFLSASSSSSSNTTSATKRRRQALAPLSSLHPSRPTPVSPKSLYRLAHFLDIPSLQSLALSALAERLTVEGVAAELFARPALGEAYDEVLDYEVDFARENWEEVKVSRAMKEASRRMKVDANPYEVETLLRLLDVQDEGDEEV
ncbi:hypothetical protein Rhopal_002107-T1 [Rhodotorula paludigena]|uniref:BTB domain-containing protein n=1 Tax=Rhodotorula paludigena TaxID=86838 RepID=A0AAV5GG52_9BASI|nr:hypothetical protein Rhopal_002107-T1 [Rhodotorula paludigena]